jgi:hypothetical protein
MWKKGVEPGSGNVVFTGAPRESATADLAASYLG